MHTKRLAKFLANVEETSVFGFDLETEPTTGRAKDAKNPKTAYPVLIALASGNTGLAVPADEEGIELLRSLLTRPDLVGVVHNSLYDLVVLHYHKLIPISSVKAKIEDTMVFQFMENENIPKNLKGLVWLHLRYRMKTYAEATKDNPEFRRITVLRSQIRDAAKSVDAFHRQRPYPAFDGRMVKKVDLKRKIRETADRRWPASEVMSASGNKRKVRSPADRDARQAFLESSLEKLDEFYGFGSQIEYLDWVTKNVTAPARAEIKELNKKLGEVLAEYATDDGVQTLRLRARLIKKLSKRPPAERVWLEMEHLARTATTRMSCNGIHIDKKEVAKLAATLDPLIEELYGDVQNLARGWVHPKTGKEFNPNSSPQIYDVLVEHLGIKIPVYRYFHGIPLPKLTDKGEALIKERGPMMLSLDSQEDRNTEIWKTAICLDREVLERITHPIAMAILNYRTVQKLRSTYVTGLLALKTDRLYGSFNSVGPKTGRLSSAGPNLQNQPSRKKPGIYDPRVQGVGPEIRKCFVAAPGKKLIVADQSQIELRLIAHITRDQRLTRIYTDHITYQGLDHSTGDIHAATSADLGVDRKSAKGINFGLGYEMSAGRFARMNKMVLENGDYDIETAAAWRTAFFEMNYGLAEYIAKAKASWVFEDRTDYPMLSHRQRHFPEDMNPSGGKILNSQVQGSSADFVKIAMIIIDKYLTKIFPSLKLVFQVHDELGVEVDECDAENAAVLVKYVLEYPWFRVRVPLLASAKICDSWYAKDDDAAPEVGVYYAEINGEPRVFTADNWADWVAAQNDRKNHIPIKGATAVMSHEQRHLCESAGLPTNLQEILRDVPHPVYPEVVSA